MIQAADTSAPGPRYRLFLAGYSAMMAAAEPLVWRYFLSRAAKDPRYGAHLEERRGEGTAFDADIWVHAVSLGEMTSAVPLVRLCLDAGYRVVTTHATPAGRSAAERAFPDQIADGRMAVRYAPIDRRRYWRRFFEMTGPRVGLVMEMEFWPAMLEAAAAAKVPLCLTNSQVPSKSLPRARRVARAFGHPVARAAIVFAKSERMAERFRMLGAEKVEALGETRFDMTIPEGQIDAGHAFRTHLNGRPVVTLASVVAGEEATYLDAIRALQKETPKPFFIWVPRAPERFGPTTEELRAGGQKVAARTDVIGSDLALLTGLDQTDILVGDSMGEMFFYLAPADAVIVGGGFLESGAHNVIEPMALGKPIVTGPNVWTIEYPAVEAEAAGVLTICKEPSDLADVVRTSMKDGGRPATDFHAANSGASARIFERILPLLR